MKDSEARLVVPKLVGGRAKVIVLDVVTEDQPPYCIHGKTTCYGCSEWCWLGSETFKVVSSGEAVGLCSDCANRTIPRDGSVQKIRNVEDHLRADGAH